MREARARVYTILSDGQQQIAATRKTSGAGAGAGDVIPRDNIMNNAAAGFERPTEMYVTITRIPTPGVTFSPWPFRKNPRALPAALVKRHRFADLHTYFPQINARVIRGAVKTFSCLFRSEEISEINKVPLAQLRNEIASALRLPMLRLAWTVADNSSKMEYIYLL